MKKRIISLLLAAAMTFSLTACGGNSSDDKKEETKTENTDNKETPEVDTIHWARANSGNILVTIAKQQGNVIKLDHNQFVSTNRSAAVELKITIEAFGTEHKNEIIEALEEEGYRPRQITANL